ncbi:efflux RND transporter periplasmic adaptor subunit [Schinkia sp. CFF1]
MKSKALYAAMGLVLLTVPVLTGCGSNAIEVSSEDVTVNVKTTAAYEGYLNNGPIFTGTVQANQEITVAPKVSGRLASVPVEVGMSVNKGDLLYAIEDDDLKNQTLQTEAAVGVAQSGIEAAKSSVQSGIIAAQNGLNQAESTVAQLQHSFEEINASAARAQQSLTDAKTNYNRMKELYAAGAASKTQLEQAETALVNAQTGMKSVEVSKKTTQDKLVAAQKAYSNAKQQLGVAKSNPQVAVSQEQLKQAQAAANIVKHSLNEATVVSPIVGTIAAVNSDAGELVSPQNPVVVVSDIGTVKILVYVPATKINTIKVGDSVQVKTAAADLTTVGKVNNVSPIDEKGKGYPVEVVVTNSDLKLKPGMVSEVMFVDQANTQGIIVPKSALVEKDGKNFVYVVKNGKAKLTEVGIAEETASQVLTSSGLSADDKVVTTKVNVLEDNMNVNEE